ncbi:hypothetical protein DL96DRAFT_1821117 [Flagelloscypha sp. PMI_526]|nr:hypothetical protein DL96DRAFT_1821117 [Flagelloscypha sp. PMI_526]
MRAFSFLLTVAALVAANPLASRAKTSFTGGHITFYEGGLTACGPRINTNSVKSVAVSTHVFNTFPGAKGNSNKNPICKTKVKATINGRTQTLLVQDSCVGCKDADLDLTQAAWDAFGVRRSVGRLGGLKWEFVGVKGRDADDDFEDNNNNNTTSFISDDNSDDTTTSEVAEAKTTTTTTDAPEGTSDSSDSGDSSTPASSEDDSTSSNPSSDSNSTTAIPDADNFTACSNAWTACNTSATGSADDAASDSCQTEYVDCVNAALASSSKKRSVGLKRHIARSRLESF